MVATVRLTSTETRPTRYVRSPAGWGGRGGDGMDTKGVGSKTGDRVLRGWGKRQHAPHHEGVCAHLVSGNGRVEERVVHGDDLVARIRHLLEEQVLRRSRREQGGQGRGRVHAGGMGMPPCPPTPATRRCFWGATRHCTSCRSARTHTLVRAPTCTSLYAPRGGAEPQGEM
jgi:hypothetical protein